MDPLTKLLRTTAFLTHGIVPLDTTQSDINRILAELPPEEANKMRRKFRKMWRAALSRFEDRNKSRAAREGMRASTGKGKPEPTRAHRRSRKQLVMNEVNRAVQNNIQKLTENEQTNPGSNT